jgi:hypothetical protein
MGKVGSPLDESSSRQIYVGWGSGVAFAFLAYISAGQWWAYSGVFIGIAIALRGHFPHLFGTYVDAQILSGLPASRTESVLKWVCWVAIALVLGCASSWIHRTVSPEKPDLVKTILAGIKALLDQQPSLKVVVTAPPPTPPSPASAAINEAIALNALIGGKDELRLQAMFAVSETRDINIRMARDMLAFYVSHNSSEDFNFGSYTPNGSDYVIDSRYGQFTPHGGAGDFRPFQNGLGIIILPPDYVRNKALLVNYLHSGTLPTTILEALKQFDSLIDKNTNSLFDVLNEAIKENPNYFVDEYDHSSATWQVIHKKCLEHFTRLEPSASAITGAIRKFLKI